MATQQEINSRQECQKSLSRIQQFDPQTLAQLEELVWATIQRGPKVTRVAPRKLI